MKFIAHTCVLINVEKTLIRIQ